MMPDSPADAVGSDAPGLRDLLVEIVRSRHALSAEAHQISATRYELGFGSQWRDLLDDTRDALKNRGFESTKLAPGGHNIPVVNGCLVYVWRVPNDKNAVSEFASSPTRRNGFTTPPPDPTLWEPSLSGELKPTHELAEDDEIAPVLRAAGDAMPLVLVMVESTPRQLQLIDWAVAVLDDEGKVELRGRETIWVPEPAAAEPVASVESFDSGEPTAPKVEPREQEGSEPDA